MKQIKMLVESDNTLINPQLSRIYPCNIMHEIARKTPECQLEKRNIVPSINNRPTLGIGNRQSRNKSLKLTNISKKRDKSQSESPKDRIPSFKEQQPVLSPVMRDKLKSNNDKLFTSPRNPSIEMRMEIKQHSFMKVDLPNTSAELTSQPHHTVWHHSPGKYSLVTPITKKLRKALILSPVKFPDIQIPKRSHTSTNSKKRQHRHLRNLFYDSLISNLKNASQDGEVYFQELPHINYDWGFGSRLVKEEIPSELKFKNFANTLFFQKKEDKTLEEPRKSIETPLFGVKRPKLHLQLPSQQPAPRVAKKKKRSSITEAKTSQTKLSKHKYSDDLNEMRMFYSKPKEIVQPKIDPYETGRSHDIEDLANLTFSPRKGSFKLNKSTQDAGKKAKNSTIPEPQPESMKPQTKLSLTNLHRLRGQSLVKLLNKYRNHSENKKAIFKKQQQVVKIKKEQLQRERFKALEKNASYEEFMKEKSLDKERFITALMRKKTKLQPECKTLQELREEEEKLRGGSTVSRLSLRRSINSRNEQLEENEEDQGKISEGENDQGKKLSYEEYLKKKEQQRKEKEELNRFLQEAASVKPKVRYYEETAGDKFYLINRMDWIDYEHVKVKKNIIKD